MKVEMVGTLPTKDLTVKHKDQEVIIPTNSYKLKKDINSFNIFTDEKEKQTKDQEVIIPTNSYKLKKDIEDITNNGFKIITPEINSSQVLNWSKNKNSEFAQPLNNIKGMKTKGLDSLIKLRPFDSFEDFINKTNTTPSINKLLLKSGSFDNLLKDSIYNNWNFLTDFFDLKTNQKFVEKAKSQKSMFEKEEKREFSKFDFLMGNYLNSKKMTKDDISDIEDLTVYEKMFLTHSLTGILNLQKVLTLDEQKIIQKLNILTPEKLNNRIPNNLIWGVVEEIEERKTKKNKSFYIIHLKSLNNKTYKIKQWKNNYSIKNPKEHYYNKTIAVLGDFDQKWGISTNSNIKTLKTLIRNLL